MTTTAHDAEARRRSARTLARAEPTELARRLRAWDDAVEVHALRAPEAGLVMVQGRIGGTGDRFHLGEATVTRATMLVRDGDDESVGTAYVLGSHPEHARLAATADALLGSAHRERVLAEVVEPLERELAAADAARDAAARATTVDFLTVAREHGPDDDEDDE